LNYTRIGPEFKWGRRGPASATLSEADPER